MHELGEWLASAREARGLTLEDAERDTRISRRYLQALEMEDLDVIPAPVYARGFLRSYAQYLGLDPQEAMARYPRDDGPAPFTSPRPPAPPPAVDEYQHSRAPAPGGGPFRSASPPQAPQQEPPPWRRPGRAAAGGGVQPVPMRREAPPEPDYYDDEGPTIGVDIGVPVPARRVQSDPAAQTRSMVVLAVAVAAIGVIILLAFIISGLGGDDAASGLPQGDDPAEGVNGDAGDEPEPTAATTGETNGDGNGAGAPSGIVPEVQGESEEAAIALIEEAGLVPNIRYEPNAGPPGVVLEQAPDAGTQREPGEQMTIIVSEEQ